MLFLPENIPAIELLKNENILVTGQPLGSRHGDSSALSVAILNIMPIKETTETDLARVLSASPLDINVTFMKLNTHTPKHASAEHMQSFYEDFNSLRNKQFDGLIITGAPVEHLDFEDVAYWQELTEIFEWAKSNVRSTLYVCWASQAGLYYHFGVNKHHIPKKMFGIFPQHQTMPERQLPLFRGFDDVFMMPHSRHTEIRHDDVVGVNGLELVAESDISGVSILMSNGGREVFITGHLEYNRYTLDTEYKRDFGKRDDVEMPKNYYLCDDMAKGPRMSWLSHATLFYTNWINYYVRPSVNR